MKKDVQKELENLVRRSVKKELRAQITEVDYKDTKPTNLITIDLGQKHRDKRLNAQGVGWWVEKADGPARIKVATVDSHEYPLREGQKMVFPAQINKLLLSNPATEGQLNLHILKGVGPTPQGGAQGSDQIAVAEGYNLDETSKQSVTADLSYTGRSIVEVFTEADTATDFTLYGSTDQVHWKQVDYATSVKTWHNGYKNAFRYIQLVSASAGTAGDEVDLIITATK